MALEERDRVAVPLLPGGAERLVPELDARHRRARAGRRLVHVPAPAGPEPEGGREQELTDDERREEAVPGPRRRRPGLALRLRRFEHFRRFRQCRAQREGRVLPGHESRLEEIGRRVGLAEPALRGGVTTESRSGSDPAAASAKRSPVEPASPKSKSGSGERSASANAGSARSARAKSRSGSSLKGSVSLASRSGSWPRVSSRAPRRRAAGGRPSSAGQGTHPLPRARRGVGASRERCRIRRPSSGAGPGRRACVDGTPRGRLRGPGPSIETDAETRAAGKRLQVAAEEVEDPPRAAERGSLVPPGPRPLDAEDVPLALDGDRDAFLGEGEGIGRQCGAVARVLGSAGRPGGVGRRRAGSAQVSGDLATGSNACTASSGHRSEPASRGGVPPSGSAKRARRSASTNPDIRMNGSSGCRARASWMSDSPSPSGSL